MTFSTVVRQEPLEIPDFLNLPFLRAIEAALQGLAAAVDKLLAAAEAGAEALRLWVLLNLDPVAALLDLLLGEIRDLLATWRDAGIGITWVIPDASGLYSMRNCFELLQTSLLDEMDPHRPITDPYATIPLTMVVFTADVGIPGSGWDPIDQFLLILAALFDLRPFRALVERDLFDTEAETPVPGQGQFPDWQAAKLVEQVPVIGLLLEAFEGIIDLFTLDVPYTQLIDELIAAIAGKRDAIASLRALVAEVLSHYEAVVGLSVSATIIQGEGTQEELVSAVESAGLQQTKTIADNSLTERERRLGQSPREVTDLGALVALYATGTSVDALKLFLGVA